MRKIKYNYIDFNAEMAKGGIPKTPLESKIFENLLEKFRNTPFKIQREAPAPN